MPKQHVEVNQALICPLCKQHNACGNIDNDVNGQGCWCNNPLINFPDELLQKVPEEARHKACICQACALNFEKAKPTSS